MTEHSVQHDDDDQHRGLDRWDVIRMGLVALVAALTWFHVWQPVSRFDVLAMAGLLVGGWPIWREALQALLERRMTMELSMTIAIGAAAIIGEFFTALVIVLFVLVAEVLEGLTVGRGRKAIKQLVDLLPRVALVRRGGVERQVSADELRVGEIILVKPGARATISVIIVAGACGIAAGTPLAILGGIGRAARLGSIIKGGVYLEALGRVQTVVLDKTGTLTLGKPEVAQVLPVPGATVLEVLETAAIAEKRSEHPLATAILRRAATEMLAASEPETFHY